MLLAEPLNQIIRHFEKQFIGCFCLFKGEMYFQLTSLSENENEYMAE